MPPSWVGAMRHSMRRTGSGMSKWTPASSSTVRSASSCIQSRNASLPSMNRAGSSSSSCAASAMVPPGTNPSAIVLHLVLDAPQLLPAPGVGLLEVHPGAEEVAGGQLVVLAAHRVVVPALRRHLVGEEAAERGDGLGRLRGVPLEVCPSAPVGRRRHERGEHARGRRPGRSTGGPGRPPRRTAAWRRRGRPAPTPAACGGSRRASGRPPRDARRCCASPPRWWCP